MRYFAPVHSHRPSKATAAQRTDPRYQTPGGANSAEILRPAAVDGDLPAEAAVGERSSYQAPLVVSVPDPGLNASGKNRLFVGYIGYTWNHLPVKKGRAPLPSIADAAFASFAARMAFSNF